MVAIGVVEVNVPSLDEAAISATQKVLAETPFSEGSLKVEKQVKRLYLLGERVVIFEVEVQARISLGNGAEESLSCLCWLYRNNTSWQPFTALLQVGGTARRFLFCRVWDKKRNEVFVTLVPEPIV